jgi:hypothetical protein
MRAFKLQQWFFVYAVVKADSLSVEDVADLTAKFRECVDFLSPDEGYRVGTLYFVYEGTCPDELADYILHKVGAKRFMGKRPTWTYMPFGRKKREEKRRLRLSSCILDFEQGTIRISNLYSMAAPIGDLSKDELNLEWAGVWEDWSFISPFSGRK